MIESLDLQISWSEYRAMSPASRASYIRPFAKARDELRAAKRQRRREWLAKSRAVFNPGARRPCSVCGRYQAIAHAHHLAPLTLQYQAGAVESAQAFAWLCPNHHVLVHVWIAAVIARREDYSLMLDLSSDESASVMQISADGLEIVEALRREAA